MSNDNFDFIGDVFPELYLTPEPYSYYDNSQGRGYGWLNQQIIDWMDNHSTYPVNFADYDNDNDGDVDMILFIYRNWDKALFTPGGLGFQGIANLGFSGSIVRDGKTIYGGFPGSGTTQRDIYTIADFRDLISHEVGHYQFGGDHFLYLGEFGIQDINEGALAMCGYERYFLNWINPTVITANTSVTITDALTTSDYYRINIPNSDEYFLLENRQKLSIYELGDACLQADLPATGLMIAHIRPSVSKSIRIQWEAADNTFLLNDPGQPTDSYKPGNKVQFTSWTRPNSDRSNGNNTGIAVTNIDQDGNTITADIILNFSSGTLTEDSWWEGSETIGGDVTLNSGKTLTVTPNTTASFASGARLTVNGSLVAESSNPAQRITFTRSGGSGSWDGIYINSGSSTNASSLRRCNITHADDGIWITYTGNSNNVTIDKCRISDSSYEGILVNGDTYSGATDHPIISDNHIHDNTNGYGIFLMNYAKPLITGNRIEDNYWGGIYATTGGSATVTFNYVTGSEYGSDFGMHFEGSSHAEVHCNTITANSGGGIYAGSSSNLTAYGAGDDEGRNKITSNSGDGIYSVDSSPIFGKDVTDEWGNNQIQDNGGYQARQGGTGDLRAEQSYWSGQHTDINGNVDNVPYLSTVPDPIGWGKSDGYDPSLLIMPKPDDRSRPREVAFLSKASEERTKFDPVEWQAKYQAAMKTGLELNDWRDAAEVITQLWRELQDARIPEVDFALLVNDVENSEIESSIRKYLALTLVEKSLAAREIAQALDDLARYRQSNSECDAELLANTGTIKLMFLNDVAGAEDILSQLQARASENDLSAAAHVRSLTLLLDKYRRNSDGTNLPRATSYSTSVGADNRVTLQVGNYPNPFNPATLIRFYLHNHENVRLAVYDVNGRLVRTLIDGELSVGEQTVLWNGHNAQGRPVGSGVYFYELRAGNEVKRGRMALLR